MDLFSPVESELLKSLIRLINHRTKMLELLFVKLFVTTMTEISKNTFKCGIKSNIAFTKESGKFSQYILRSGSLLHPLCKRVSEIFY